MAAPGTMREEFEARQSEIDEERYEREREEKSKQTFDALGSSLHAEALNRTRLRAGREDVWLRSSRQIRGLYDAPTQARLDQQVVGSKVFVNITRKLANTAESRLLDVIQPTEDRNFSIQPTPVPFLARTAGVIDETPVNNDDGTPFITDKGVQVEERDVKLAEMAEAKEKSLAMQEVIDDQLKDSNWNSVQRQVVRQAVRLGTGILKGPVIVTKQQKNWVKKAGAEDYSIEHSPIVVPATEWVDVWDFFPDMDVNKISDSSAIFQRHRLRKKDLIDLAINGAAVGFKADQIVKVLEQSKNGIRTTNTSTYLTYLRDLNGINNVKDEFFETWEYHGPVSKEQLESCGCEVDKDNVLEEYEGVVWFIDSHVIKAVVTPSDTEEKPYSVFCWEEDESSIFGTGIPEIMNDSQKVMNSTWRMAMDNGGLLSGPQTVVNKEHVRPQNGVWEITGRKMWICDSPEVDIDKVFQTFDIQSNVGQLVELFKFARSLADEETAIPQIAQGEQGDATDTARGMAILIGSANTLMRGVVKNWDDQITTPHITRMYDWNMQFNEDESIKGDFSVDARGVSSLLVKEENARNLVTVMNMAASPMLITKTNTTDLWRKVVNSMQLDSSEIVLTDEEIKANEEEQSRMAMEQQEKELVGKSEAGDELARKRLEILYKDMEIKAQLKQMEIDVKRDELALKREEMVQVKELELVKLAQEQNISLSTLKTNLGIKQLDARSKNALYDKEAALKRETGDGI